MRYFIEKHRRRLEGNLRCKTFFGVGAEPVGSDRYNWFFPPWKTIAMVVNKTRDIS